MIFPVIIPQLTLYFPSYAISNYIKTFQIISSISISPINSKYHEARTVSHHCRSSTEAGKPQFNGPNLVCRLFLYEPELRILFTLLNSWENIKEVYFVMWKLYELKFQRLYIKLYWRAHTHKRANKQTKKQHKEPAKTATYQLWNDQTWTKN